MIGYRLNVSRPLRMQMTGKFTAPAPDWMHMNRVLADFELFVQTRGKLYIADGEKKHVLQEGDFLLMPPGSRQYGYRGSDCSFYWLHFAGDEAQAQPCDMSTFQPEAGVVCLPTGGALAGADRLVVMLKQLQDAVRAYRDQTLNDYLTTSIVCELYNQTVHAVRSPKPRQLQLYNDVVDYIHWHRFAPLKVAQVAEHFGYNAKYLSQLFAAVSGMTIKQYMLQQKIEAASYLLADTNQTVKQIALQLGFADSQHFMKTFKKLTNLTPTGYRNAAAGRLLYYE